MEQAAADSARIRAILDPKPDDLKNPCTLVREGPLAMVEKGKPVQHYCFLFHSVFFVTKEVKPKAKYKIILAIKIRPTLKIVHEETEQENVEFSIDGGKKVVVFNAENGEAAAEWVGAISKAMDGEYDPSNVKPTFKDVNGDSVWDVTASLNETESNLLKQLHNTVNEMDISPELKEWCDDACLCRFLRARQWDIKKATEMLKNTLNWRAETHPESIKLEEISHAGSTGDLYLSKGKDRKGRVIVYMRPGKSEDTPQIRAQYVRHMAWIMETGCKLLDTTHTAQEKLTWIVDFQGCKITGGIDENVKSSKDVINVMQNMYPERLGMGFILNPPLPFWMLWQVVSAFLDPVTKRKVQFIRNKKDQAVLLDYIEKSQLEVMYGGDIAPFDAEEWKREFFPNETSQ